MEFADTVIRGAGEYGIFVYDGAEGAVSLRGTVIAGARTGEISNHSKREIIGR